MALGDELGEKLVDSIVEICVYVKEKRYWKPEDYTQVIKTIETLLCMVEKEYMKTTTSTLKDTCRRIFEDRQYGGFEIFVDFYNAYLVLRKLQYLVEYHQDYGKFPDEDICN